jgi:hypothetical protein
VKLSKNIKATRLHRLYQVVFWLLIAFPILLVPLSMWIQNNLVHVQISVSEYARTHNIPPEVSIHEWSQTQNEIDAYTVVALVSIAAFIFALLLPLLYRLLLYILHGKTAFR